MNPTTTDLLRVLRGLDESRLRDGHFIDHDLLEHAVYAWRDAGCPDVDNGGSDDFMSSDDARFHRGGGE